VAMSAVCSSQQSILCAFGYSGALMRLIEHYKYKKWSVRSVIRNTGVMVKQHSGGSDRTVSVAFAEAH